MYPADSEVVGSIPTRPGFFKGNFEPSCVIGLKLNMFICLKFKLYANAF